GRAREGEEDAAQGDQGGGVRSRDGQAVEGRRRRADPHVSRARDRGDQGARSARRGTGGQHARADPARGAGAPRDRQQGVAEGQEGGGGREGGRGEGEGRRHEGRRQGRGHEGRGGKDRRESRRGKGRRS